MKHITNEAVKFFNYSVKLENGIAVPTEKTVISAEKYAMSHGSHNEHSSQGTYGD